MVKLLFSPFSCRVKIFLPALLFFKIPAGAQVDLLCAQRAAIKNRVEKIFAERSVSAETIYREILLNSFSSIHHACLAESGVKEEEIGDRLYTCRTSDSLVADVTESDGNGTGWTEDEPSCVDIVSHYILKYEQCSIKFLGKFFLRLAGVTPEGRIPDCDILSDLDSTAGPTVGPNERQAEEPSEEPVGLELEPKTGEEMEKETGEGVNERLRHVERARQILQERQEERAQQAILKREREESARRQRAREEEEAERRRSRTK